MYDANERFSVSEPDKTINTWDVVASALNLKARTAAEVLEIVPEAHLQYLFGPMDWKEHTYNRSRVIGRARQALYYKS